MTSKSMSKIAAIPQNAEKIAECADRGENISRYFTNTGIKVQHDLSHKVK